VTGYCPRRKGGRGTYTSSGEHDVSLRQHNTERERGGGGGCEGKGAAGVGDVWGEECGGLGEGL